MKSVPTIDWLQTAGQGRASLLTIDATIDQLWTVTLNGTDETGTPVAAKYVVIDNLSNNATLTFAYGPFLYRVVPYTRKTFPILLETASCQFNILAGRADIIFANFNPEIPDDVNQVSTSGAGAQVVYSVRQLLTGVSYGMTSADNNTLFIVDTGSDFDLILPQSSDVSAPFFMPMIYNRSATHNLRILPATLMYGVYLRASSYGASTAPVFGPGTSFEGYCDGLNFYLHQFQ